MARLAAILKALARAFWRDQKSLGSIATNNFFLISLIFLQQAGAFIYLILGLVMFFPLSADPLRKVPPDRLALWPLSRRQRWLLRACSPWVNPATWLMAALAVWAGRHVVSAGLWALLSALFAIGFLLPMIPSARRGSVWRHVPTVPGLLGQLIRKDLREMLSMLDFYCALILSVSGVVYRLTGRAREPDALMALTILIVLALSSYAQSLFGLDGEDGLTRYRLLPLRGWRVLAAKHAAFLLIVLLLTLPLSPIAGLAAALVALAIGNGPSISQHRPQARWHFCGGASFGIGIFQAFAMTLAAVTTSRSSPLTLIPCLAVYAASTWWYGRAFDRAASLEP